MMAWHCVRLTGRSDKASLDWLERLQFPTFYPKIFEPRRLRKNQMSARQRSLGIDIRRPVLVPLLPRYAFCAFDAGSRWREAFDIAGVAGLGAQNLPVMVPQKLIDHIGGCVGGFIAPGVRARAVFRAGELVRINGGPFSGLNAVIERALDVPFALLDPALRVAVVLELFGRPTSIELDACQIERV